MASFKPPLWFPRSLVQDEDEDLTKQRYSMYLSLPKGEARQTFIDRLRKKFAQELVSESPQKRGKKSDDEIEPLEEALGEPAEAPFREDAESVSPLLVKDKAELRKAVMQQMELLARAHNATVIDMRRIYQQWLDGKKE